MDRIHRMYGFVPYNLSPIQQGIQFGHAVQEYNNKVTEIKEDHTKGLMLSYKEAEEVCAFQKWSREDKTFIILNGGTTNNNPEKLGTLNLHLETLNEIGVTNATFHEPDLGDQLTAVVFIVDERVFDKENWPDFKGIDYDDGTHDPEEYSEWKLKFSDDEQEAERIIFLREFLPKFRLA